MIDYHKIDWSRVKLEQKIIKGVDQTIYTFDIETSSGYIPPGAMVAHEFDFTKSPDYYRKCQKVAVCYLWQFGINDNYYYGRELRDFEKILNKLEEMPGQKIVWVHNLSYEQVFLLNLFFPDKIFAKKAHSVIYFEYGTIQFRCSYMLTNLGLKAWAKQIGAPPKLEDFDYLSIRTPLSKLDAFTLEYGQRDLEIIVYGIREMLKEYKKLQAIPMTNTGRVRRAANAIFANDIGYRFKMARLLPKDANEYIRLRMAFSGGNTHANWFYAGVLLKADDVCGGVSCGDIASSYPTEMCAGLLPMAPFREAKKPERFLNNKKYRCIMEVELVDLKPKMHIDYISYSKVYDIAYHLEKIGKRYKKKEHCIIENGKIHSIEYGKMMITDDDYDIIKEAYSGEVRILRLWYSRAGRLDKRYVEFILDLYEKKTALKDVEGAENEALYHWSKTLINGCYGDFVSSLCYPDTELLDTGEWKEVEKTEEEINERLDYLRHNPWKLKSSFAWGVFITSGARKSHFRILKYIDAYNHVVYYDTDSVYYIGNHDREIRAYNNLNKARMDKAMEELGIDPERTRPKDSKGKVHQMGEIEIEKRDLPEFKCLRAKCYGYRDHEGELHTTISGVSKKYGAHALKGDLDNLTTETEFGYNECGRKISTYNRNQPPCIWIDKDGVAYGSSYKFGLNLMPSKYNLSLPQDFIDTLNLIGSLSSRISSISIDKLAKMEKAGH
jgi:hypothetical protein